MKRLLVAGLVLALPVIPAMAQNTTPGTVTQPTAPAPANSVPSPSTTRLSTTQPPAVQSSATRPSTLPADQSSPSTAASAEPPSGAVPGANSFTESQARSRLEKYGYSQVSGLAKGKDGIWRGQAMKNGSSVQVSVDYKGDISMN